MDLPGVFYHSGTDGGGSSGDAPPPGTFFNDQDQEMYRGNEQGDYFIHKCKDLYVRSNQQHLWLNARIVKLGNPQNTEKMAWPVFSDHFLNNNFRK